MFDEKGFLNVIATKKKKRKEKKRKWQKIKQLQKKTLSSEM
jgi:hypothetical protein